MSTCSFLGDMSTCYEAIRRLLGWCSRKTNHKDNKSRQRPTAVAYATWPPAGDGGSPGPRTRVSGVVHLGAAAAAVSRNKHNRKWKGRPGERRAAARGHTGHRPTYYYYWQSGLCGSFRVCLHDRRQPGTEKKTN